MGHGRLGLDIGKTSAFFAQKHCFQIPSLIAGRKLAIVLDAVHTAEFYEFTHPSGSREQLSDDVRVARLLQFLLNETAVVKELESITGVGPLGCFSGHFYRMQPGGIHFGEWHTDCVNHRMLGMTVNLSSQPFEGGDLELRECDSDCESIRCCNNVRPGDALVFRIDPRIEHRVLSVRGTVPKLAYAGWFLEGSSWLDQMKAAAPSQDGPNEPSAGRPAERG